MSSYIVNGTCISGTCQSLAITESMPLWLPLVFAGLIALCLTIYIMLKRSDGEDKERCQENCQ